MYCQYCGTKLEDNFKYCANCGHEIVSSTNKVVETPKVEVVNMDTQKTSQPFEKSYFGFGLASTIMSGIAILFFSSFVDFVSSISSSGSYFAFFVFFYLPIVLPLAILSICFGSKAIKGCAQYKSKSGRAVAGYSLGIIGVVLGSLSILKIISNISNWPFN